ncbi:Low molecular weight protein-tyrosine-phosphatase Ptp [Castellaniella defragrans]
MPVESPLLLLLCTGNMCRSPMAEVIMRDCLARRGIAATVLSRGLAAPTGRAPHPFALRTAAEFGVAISPNKRAAPVNPVDLRLATVVLVMDKGHRHEVQQRYPAAGGKTFLLGHWQGEQEIPDPLHEPESVFQAQWPVMRAACEAWIDHLLLADMLKIP